MLFSSGSEAGGGTPTSERGASKSLWVAVDAGTFGFGQSSRHPQPRDTRNRLNPAQLCPDLRGEFHRLEPPVARWESGRNTQGGEGFLCAHHELSKLNANLDKLGALRVSERELLSLETKNNALETKSNALPHRGKEATARKSANSLDGGETDRAVNPPSVSLLHLVVAVWFSMILGSGFFIRSLVWPGLATNFAGVPFTPACAFTPGCVRQGRKRMFVVLFAVLSLLSDRQET